MEDKRNKLAQQKRLHMFFNFLLIQDTKSCQWTSREGHLPARGLHVKPKWPYSEEERKVQHNTSMLQRAIIRRTTMHRNIRGDLRESLQRTGGFSRFLANVHCCQDTCSKRVASPLSSSSQSLGSSSKSLSPHRHLQNETNVTLQSQNVLECLGSLWCEFLFWKVELISKIEKRQTKDSHLEQSGTRTWRVSQDPAATLHSCHAGHLVHRRAEIVGLASVPNAHASRSCPFGLQLYQKSHQRLANMKR